jgi:hypothetical protein
MHNLAKDEEQSTLAEESTSLPEEISHNIQIISEDDPRVQIYVNGVTYSSTDNIRLDPSLNTFKECYGDNTPGVRRRSSWCPQTSTIREDFQRNYVNKDVFSQGKR